MKLLIIDGLNTFIRSFVVVPAMDVNGEAIGGIVGFLKSVKAQIREVLPDRVIVAWDGEGGSQRRRGVYSAYKEGRKVRLNRQYDMESQDDQKRNLGYQLMLLKQLLDLIGIIQIEVPNIEADDTIAFLCKFVYPDHDKVVLTSDKDMLQLVDDRTIVYSPTKKVYWSTSEMKEKMNVLPENWIYVKALCGDASDNVEGMGRIGEKTALKMYPFLSERPSDLKEIRAYTEANLGTGTKYKSVMEQWDRLVENVQLMQLSNPTISVQAVHMIRTSATAQKPRFVFTEFKLELSRFGIQVLDSDFIQVFQGYKHRAEAIT